MGKEQKYEQHELGSNLRSFSVWEHQFFPIEVSSNAFQHMLNGESFIMMSYYDWSLNVCLTVSPDNSAW